MTLVVQEEEVVHDKREDKQGQQALLENAIPPPEVSCVYKLIKKQQDIWMTLDLVGQSMGS